MESKTEENKKRLSALYELRKSVFTRLASTTEGKLFIHFMMRDCGFMASSLVFDETKNIAHDAVVINEALRQYYLNIRKFIPTDLLKDIEYLDLEKYTKQKGETTNGTNK